MALHGRFAACIMAWGHAKWHTMSEGVLYCMSTASVSDGLLSAAECLDLLIAAKTAQWSTLYYGQLPLLVTFAAAKTHIQFYIIERGSIAHPKAVGSEIMLDTMAGRVKLLLAAVNLHRILRAVESYLP